MIKQAPRPLQVAVLVAFVMSCFGVLLYLWISFGGVVPVRPEGYRIKADFPEATQLAIQSDVRISGVPVGKVIETDLAPGNRTTATLELRSRYAPIPKNTRAMLRQKTLLGETYVDLSQGDPAKGSLPDGGTLPRSAVAETVELDEIFRTFDEDTREAWATWMQSQAGSVEGRGADVNAFFANLPSFLNSADDLVTEMNAQSEALSGAVRGTGEVFSALSERDGQLRRLITESNKVFQVTADRNREFAGIWKEFPRFERESREFLPRLTQFSENAQPVVEKLQPVASAMEPAFAQLKRLGPEYEGFFRGLGPVITASERGVPAVERLLKRFPSLLASFEPFLRNFNPILNYLGQNRREIGSFIANGTASSLGRDLPVSLSDPIRAKEAVQYLRSAQTLTPQALTYYPRPLGQSRGNPYIAPNGLDRLSSGLASFDTRSCTNGDPTPPTSSEPATLAPLVQLYAFRTTGRNVLRPPCVAQGNFPGYGTQFPQLRAEP
jgi:phospholipid/cholesterol/gamma-HCH transport system substrate-binding protein